MAHHEAIERRGKIQTLIYIMREIGRLLISIVIIFGFSGPETACPGYEADPNVPCTTDESVTSRNDQFESNPDDWCHVVCDAADFPFGLTIPQFVWIIASVNIVSIPAYFLLYEEKRAAEKVTAVLGAFWKVMKKKAVWMLVLYTMISSITFNVFIAAKASVPMDRRFGLIFDLVGYCIAIAVCLASFIITYDHPPLFLSPMYRFFSISEQCQFRLAWLEQCTESNAGYLRECHLLDWVRSYSSLRSQLELEEDGLGWITPGDLLQSSIPVDCLRCDQKSVVLHIYVRILFWVG